MKRLIEHLLNWLVSHQSSVIERLPLRASTSAKRQIARGVKQFFDQYYELRYNTLKQCEEFRPRLREEPPDGREVQGISAEAWTNSAQGALDGWQQLTDRELRRIVFEQMETVGVAWSVDIELFVRSSITCDYNPVNDFLCRCPPWDGHTDYIRQLAQRVPCNFPEWPDWFHRWFLGMVAQWQQRSRDYGNSLVPLLIGGQGLRKSTFCKLILPPQLREYYIDDIKLDSPEQVERMLARMLLVNIDEYNAKTDREQAKIKRVLTERDVQTRKMRSDQYLMLPRMASFIATTNEREPLTDSTGSRRYLCCEVMGIIDTDTPVLYNNMYAQAQYELEHGAVWYLYKQEEAALEQHNMRFQQQSTPEQILLAWFEPAERSKDNFIRAVDIQRLLGQHVLKSDLPNLKMLTLALKRAHFPYGSYKGQRGWYARYVSQTTDNQ